MPKIIADEHIFQAVMQVVAAYGYAGASTRQMAEAAGVSEVTLFRKYGSKAELVRRAIHALIDDSDFESVTRYSGDLRADLMRVLEAYRDTVVLHGGFFFALFAEFKRTPELAEAVVRPLALFRSIGELLERYQREGVLRREDPLHAVASLLGPLVYLSIMGSSAPGLSLAPVEMEAHIDLFLEGRQVSEGRAGAA